MIRILSRVQRLLPPALLLLLASCSSTVITPSITLSASKTQVTTPEGIFLTATLPPQITPTRVEFYEGNTKLGQDTARPFNQFVYYAAHNNGTHTYTARAILSPTSTLTSDPVQVNVNINATITQVSVQAASSVLVGQSTPLTATVTGTGSFSAALTWEILEGGGTLSDKKGLVVNYTAPLSATTVKVKATSVQDPSKSATVTLQVVPANNPLISIEGPLQVVAGQQAFFQGKYLNFEVSRDVTWKVLQGPGQITEEGIYTSPPDATGTVQILVSSKVKPEIGRVITVNIKEAATLIRHNVIRTSPQLVVALTSTYSITEVKAEVPEVNFSGLLSFSNNAYTESGNPRPGYVGTLPLDTLSQGEHVLKLTSTDTRGNVVTQDFIFVVNRPPKIISKERLESRFMVVNPDGTYPLKASCTDEGNPCEVILAQFVDTPANFADVVHANDNLDIVLGTNGLRANGCYRVFAGDLYGTRTPLVPPITDLTLGPDYFQAICFSLIPEPLQLVARVPGTIEDVQGNRILSVNTVTQDSLSIFENFTIEHQFETKRKIDYELDSYLPRPLLSNDKAIYLTEALEAQYPNMTTDVFTTDNSEVPLIKNAIGPVFASEEIIVWKSQGDALYSFGSLVNFSKTPLGDVTSGSFSRDGKSFVFIQNGNVYLLKNAQVTQITFDGKASGTPQVDNDRILYFSTAGTTGLYLWDNGQSTLISSKALRETNLGPGFIINGTHIAYMEPDATNVRQVWQYTLGGEKKQLTDHAQSSLLQALGDDGRVALWRNTVFVQNTAGDFINTGIPYNTNILVSTIRFINNDWYFILGNALLKLK